MLLDVLPRAHVKRMLVVLTNRYRDCPSNAAKNFLIRLKVSRYSSPHFVVLYFFEFSRMISFMKPCETRKFSSFFVLSTGMLAPYETLVREHSPFLAIISIMSA